MRMTYIAQRHNTSTAVGFELATYWSRFGASTALFLIFITRLHVVLQTSRTYYYSMCFVEIHHTVVWCHFFTPGSFISLLASFIRQNFLSSAVVFLFKINIFRRIISGVPSVFNSLGPDQARRFVGPGLGPNCLKKLSEDDSST